MQCVITSQNLPLRVHHGAGRSPTGLDPGNSLGDQDIGIPGRPVSSEMQVACEPGHCRARAREPWWIYHGVFPSNCPSIAPEEMSIFPRWYFGPLKDDQCGGCRLDAKKLRRENFQRIFALGIFWGGVSRYALTPIIVVLSWVILI